MPPECPYIVRVDYHSDEDRYGNSRSTIVVWSAVPINPHSKGYDPVVAAEVLRAARWHKSSHPDAEVRIEEGPAPQLRASA